jgi:hypothetical protein
MNEGVHPVARLRPDLLPKGIIALSGVAIGELVHPPVTRLLAQPP